MLALIVFLSVFKRLTHLFFRKELVKEKIEQKMRKEDLQLEIGNKSEYDGNFGHMGRFRGCSSATTLS